MTAFHLRLFGGFQRQILLFRRSEETVVDGFLPEEASFIEGDGFRKVHFQVTAAWYSLFMCMKKPLVHVISLHIISSAFLCGSIFAARKLLNENRINTSLHATTLVFFICEFLSLLLMYLASRRIARIRAATKSLLLMRFNNNLSMCSSQFHLESGAEGRIATIQNTDLALIGNFIASLLLTFIPALIMLIVFTFVSFYSLGSFGLFACGLSLGQLPISLALGKLQPKFRKAQNLSLDRLSSLLMNWLTQARQFRTGKLEDFQEQLLLKVYNEHLKGAMLEHLISIGLFVVSFCWWLIPVFISVIYSLSMKETDPEIVAKVLTSTWILITLSNALRRVPVTISLLGPAKIAMQRLTPYLLQAPHVREDHHLGSAETKEFGKPVAWSLNQVTVMSNERALLDNVSQKLSMTEKLWIIGAAGSGKTTLLSLLLGLKSPDLGWIGIENEEGKQFDLKNPSVRAWLHTFVKPVPQSTFLFQGDLQSNVSLSNGELHADAVAFSMKNACLSAEFSGQNALENTVIEEEGRNLSGGQRQRVSLSRALSYEPKCLILDQCFSAIDSFTASLIYGNLLKIPNLRGLIFLSSAPPEFIVTAEILTLTHEGIQRTGGK